MSDALPQGGTPSLHPESELEDDVLVQVDNLVKHFPVKAGGLIGRTVGDTVTAQLPGGARRFEILDANFPL